MYENYIIDGNSVYEIDEECMREKGKCIKDCGDTTEVTSDIDTNMEPNMLEVSIHI